VKASIIQGSGLGPVSYLVTAVDLHPMTAGNRIFKYADDTYLLVPSTNSTSRLDEIAHIERWAAENNLKLNCTKSKEIIFKARGVRGPSAQPPPPCLNIERVSSLNVLGVIVNDRLSASDHVSNLLESCSRLLYAFCVLHIHGLPSVSLQDVFRTTILAKIQYCSPAWSGYCSAADQAQLDGFLKRCKRRGLCEKELPSVTQIFDDADNIFFADILRNNQHVLQTFLPDRIFFTIST